VLCLWWISEKTVERKTWSEAELELLRRNFADSRTDDLAQALGRPYSAVAQKAATLGLRKSEAYLAGPLARRLDGVKGMQTRFKPGAQAWNKGKHYQPGGRCSESQFKKGRPAHEARNYVPIGSLRVSKDGYAERKVTDDPALVPTRRWVAVHRLVWIEAHGHVPDGHAVCFKPGRFTADPEAITADALELVTRRELMLRNTYHRYGKDVAKLVQLRGALTRQINKRAKEEA
jgi:hypothetical protein